MACSKDDASVPSPSAAVGAGADVPLATLPDAVVFADGHRVTTKEEWPARCAEILDLFAKNVYGRSPEKPDALDFSVVEANGAAM